jgi:hypothetical protein
MFRLPTLTVIAKLGSPLRAVGRRAAANVRAIGAYSFGVAFAER